MLEQGVEVAGELHPLTVEEVLQGELVPEVQGVQLEPLEEPLVVLQEELELLEVGELLHK